MKTLRISRDFSNFQFILIFVDYNPNSKSRSLEHISELPFAKQVRVFYYRDGDVAAECETNFKL